MTISQSSEIFAKAYVAYELQDSINRIASITHNGTNLNFVSNKDHPNGLYEKIFNESTHFENSLCSMYITGLIEDFLKSDDSQFVC